MQVLSVGKPKMSFAWGRNSIVTLLLFFLLWEWLRPLIELSHVTDLYITRPFLIAVGCFLLVDYFRVPSWIGWPLKLFICLAIVGYFFHQSTLFDFSWWNLYAEITVQDGKELVRGEIHLFSSENRTLLFLMGWSFMISAVQSLMYYRESAGWFIAATLTYLIILQLWAGVDTTAGIIRSLAFGLVLLALLNLPKIERRYGISERHAGRSWIWMASSLCLICTSIALGIYFSKSESQAVEPLSWNGLHSSFAALPWLSDTDVLPISGERSKSGYGEDDTRLGGKLTQDTSIAFIAQTDELTYWRGESKSLYDGKGWKQPEGQELHAFDTVRSLSLDPDKWIMQEIMFHQQNKQPVLFTGGAVMDFQGILTDSGKLLSSSAVVVNELSGKYSLDSNEPVQYYKMKVALPSRGNQYLSLSLDSQQLESYLQLPDKFPQRVRKLAQQAAGDAANAYDAAERIESFLRSNYEYSLDKVDYPRLDQDFVDHFLFHQKVGYCDHFSTAMVTMLRSLDIPARWVKGFTPGEVSPVQEGTVQDRTAKHTVIVRSLDAHSWVEAYIPDRGWVAFEPTPGFTDETELQLSGVERQNESLLSEQAFRNKAISFVKKLAGLDIRLVLTVLIVIGISGILIGFSIKWLRMGRNMNTMYKIDHGLPRSGRSDGVLMFFDRFWLKVFKRFGQQIEPKQTIREYIQNLQLADETKRQALVELVTMYEALRYNNAEREWISKDRILRTWRKIIR
jgi:hypothetical protein